MVRYEPETPSPIQADVLDILQSAFLTPWGIKCFGEAYWES